MKRIATVVLAFALLAPAARADDLVHLGTTDISARLKELAFTTPALAAETRVRVLLPAGYDASGATLYPVLWLLNGALDNQTSWTEKGDAERISAGFPLIVVMPDGGTGGGYTDWYNDGAGGPPAWETYHLGQLLPWIDAHLPTTGTRSGRAIAGLSMGGGGAMAYAARHPQLFAAAAAFSGAVDTNNVFVQPLTDTALVQEGKPPGSVFGTRALHEVRWRGHNPWDLAMNLAGLDLTVRTGNGLPGGPGGDSGDPVESGVHEQSVSFHKRLQELGVPHLWDDYGAGGHAWYYWQRGLTQLLPDLMAVFADPPAPPSPFDFTAIEPAYDVYGWHVAIERPALEFSELRGADAGGFTLRGSGRAVVTSAPAYVAGRTYDVAVRDLDGEKARAVEADAAGRLTVPLNLGPGNAHQQYSPEARADGASHATDNGLGTAPGDAQRWPVYAAHVRVYARAAAGAARGSCAKRVAVRVPLGRRGRSNRRVEVRVDGKRRKTLRPGRRRSVRITARPGARIELLIRDGARSKRVVRRARCG